MSGHGLRLRARRNVYAVLRGIQRRTRVDRNLSSGAQEHLAAWLLLKRLPILRQGLAVLRPRVYDFFVNTTLVMEE